MKVGSLVVIKAHQMNQWFITHAQWLPVMDENTVYTVRKIGACVGTNQPIIMLEEGIIGYTVAMPFNIGKDLELGIRHTMVKEVQPPMEISIESFLEETIEK
jgi:hypothetical protein